MDTLVKVRERVADLLLVHGGGGEGVDRLAAAWPQVRKVPPGGVRAGQSARPTGRVQAQQAMLSLKLRYLVAFAGG